MMAVASVAAGFEVAFLWHTAELERLGDVVSHRFLHAMHFLLGVEKATGNGVVQETLPLALEFGDFLVT
jgi:hypothetical protein